MKLLESIKNAVAIELTADSPSEITKAWDIFTKALNLTKDVDEIKNALEYTQSNEFIKCVALPDNYSALIKNYLENILQT